MDQDTFFNHLRQSGLLSGKAIDEAAAGFSGTASGRAIARALVAKKRLTRFQARMLLAGRPNRLSVGPYQILEQLGRGVTGPVFKAMDTAMDRVVAIKVIHPRVLKDSGLAFDLFLREVRAAAQMHHPGIVTARDAGVTEGRHFLVMEYIDGPSLQHLVQTSGPLPVGLACDLMRQAAEALQYAHDKGIVHRDIKPANLLIAHASSFHLTGVTGDLRTQISSSGSTVVPKQEIGKKEDSGNEGCAPTVKLIDFGLARMCQAGIASAHATIKVEPGTVWGTVDYIAPEQAENIHAADIRSDLYSLGCTFYFALTGQVPFPGGNDLEKLVQHLLYQAPSVSVLRPEVPAAIAAIIQRLMAKQRARRFQTPAELARELASISRTSGFGAPAQAPTQTAPRADSAPLFGDSRAGVPSTVDDLLASHAGAAPIGSTLLEDWRSWTTVVESFVHGRGGRNWVDPHTFRLLRKRLVEACEAQAGASEGQLHEFFQRLADLVKPWLSQETFMQSDKEILSSLLWYCQQAEVGLRQIIPSSATTEPSQTVLGGIMALFKRR
jgi:serine/threonine-protein kinase